MDATAESSARPVLSIDQNCHPLWDVVPKLHALARQGFVPVQCIEDIDVAFTSMGSLVGSTELRLERERYYRSGGQDWGAAMFYTHFLGLLPVELRQWEPFTGLATSAMASQLGRQIDELYDDYSPADNWQLIGPSYAGDAHCHRVMGDLTVAETAGFLHDMLALAREKTLDTFPQQHSRQRTTQWFDAQQATLEKILRQSPVRLMDLYRLWLAECFGDTVAIDSCSSFFLSKANAGARQLFELFVTQYDHAAELYNRAVEETHLGLHALDTRRGELPFYAVFERKGRLVRSEAALEKNRLRLGEMSFELGKANALPLDELVRAGIRAMPGKAILLVMQARMGATGRPLALPYHGSAYMPASFRLQELLTRENLLTGPLQPIVRVRLHLLDRLAELEAIIRLPPHLEPYFGRAEIPARELCRNWQAIARQAQDRLEQFRNADFRRQWEKQTFPDLLREIDDLERCRREMAARDSKSPEIRMLWKELKPRKAKLIEGLLRQVARDWQAAQIEYYDSRGAIWPWCVALGGEEFYNSVIARANIYEENAP